MKKFTPFIIPFFLQHVLTCGVLLFYLVSSGYLLLLRQEADNKIYLLPGLMITGLLFIVFRNVDSNCEKNGHRSLRDYCLLFFLYGIFSILLGIVFMIYIFLPWWLPNYKGGPLLP